MKLNSSKWYYIHYLVIILQALAIFQLIFCHKSGPGFNGRVLEKSPKNIVDKAGNEILSSSLNERASVMINTIFLSSPPLPNLIVDARGRNLLVIIVLTSPSEANSRILVRQTWGSLVPLSHKTQVEILFPIGIHNLTSQLHQSILKEQINYGDLILLSELHDSYRNLTEKVLQSIVAVNEYHEAEYLLKVDADSFVNIAELLKELSEIFLQPRAKKLYWGFITGRGTVLPIERNSKWSETEWHLCDRYLPYAVGGGYLLGKDLLQYIARNHQLFSRYANEDVSIGAWLAGLDVFYLHDNRFDTEYRSRGCQNAYIISHKLNETQIHSYYHNLVESGKMCDREYRTRSSYVYNWTVLPSQCCQRTRRSHIL